MKHTWKTRDAGSTAVCAFLDASKVLHSRISSLPSFIIVFADRGGYAGSAGGYAGSAGEYARVNPQDARKQQNLRRVKTEGERNICSSAEPFQCRI